MFRGTARPRSYATAAAALTAAALAASPAWAAHESNNRAELVGSTASGVAIVNYAKGAPDEWKSTVNVDGLAPGAYTFRVAGGPQNRIQPVCDFVIEDNGGRQGCSDQSADLSGFSRAEIVDATGAVVASGVFERRGGQRV